MSSTPNDVGEPNLTPLLDLVLQLLMFFLIVANFVVEQTNQDIKLPEATTAVPIDKESKYVLPVNVDQDGKVVIATNSYLETEPQINRWMKDQYDFAKRDKGEQVAKDMVVVVRGDGRTNFRAIYQVMKAARQVGFSNVQLRANRPVGG